MELINEYLIIVDKANSDALYNLCDTPQEFKKLLQTDSDIVIKGNKLKYKNNVESLFEVYTNNIEGKEQRFFHTTISFTGDENSIDEYSSALRAFKSVVIKAGGQLETLNNDISTYYSNKSYPVIHKLENLMRKLITYFMLTQVGKDWVVEASPKDVKEAIDRGKKPQQYVDALHKVDFIHLGDFLFKAYQTKNISELYELFDSISKSEELNLDDLREFKAKSNWEKYFSKVVDCTDDYLKNRWEELYLLRCKVAHNSIVNKADYERLLQLASEVSEKLNKAVVNIGKVQVPEEEKETLVENEVSSINNLLGEFVNYWRLFESALNKFAFDYDFLQEDMHPFKARLVTSPRLLLNEMKNSKLIPDSVYNDAIEISHYRNYIMHNVNFTFDEQNIISWIHTLKNLINYFERTIDVTTWKDEVVRALTFCGGEAHLIDIYNEIENKTSKTLTETWKSNVRKTLQSYSSDAKSYSGGEDLFYHADVGRWGLRDFKAEIDK